MGGNVFQRELASNGPFQFFAAFRNNELDYQQFYATLPDPRAAALLRAELSEPIARFVGSDPLDIRRAIDNPGLEQRRNLVLVTIETPSALLPAAVPVPMVLRLLMVLAAPAMRACRKSLACCSPYWPKCVAVACRPVSYLRVRCRSPAMI